MRLVMFDGSFQYGAVTAFTTALADAFNRRGLEVTRIEVNASPTQLGESLSAVCDAGDVAAFLGFNTLGSNIQVDGAPLYEALGVPFISYLVDHPLFHAGALSKLGNQPILCVDEAHVQFLEGFGLTNVHFVPHGGVTPENYFQAPKWMDRPGRVLFPGSFEPVDAARRRLTKVVADDAAMRADTAVSLVEAFEALADEGPFTTDGALLDAAAYHPLTFEAQRFIGVDAHYTTMLRCLIRLHRARLRADTLAGLDAAGLAVDLVGNGWEGADFVNHRVLSARPFEDVQQLMTTYRFVAHIPPLFGAGTHERVINGALAGALVCVDENPAHAPLISGGGAIGYPVGDAPALAAAINRLDLTEEGARMAATGREIASFQHTWAARARQIADIVGL